MTSIPPDSPPLPPMAAVAEVLRSTTWYLAGELADPETKVPNWSGFEWPAARALAAMHGISGVLAEELRWRRPDGWVEFLSRQHKHIARRQACLRKLLTAVGWPFRRAGSPFGH